ncbi:hypothetical protein SAY87_007286 [Trapa incisa]|uniref:STI1 domain-containing protein n=1 Tax=Trapa incisa TaxID=236973 RepID=A0AAN7Q0Z9_9MYRT|nr:hypothetical protein SAY87_007286 [Trapa incisa]
MSDMQNLLNNPDQLTGLIMSNPLMHVIIDRNPVLACVLVDPSIMQQTLEAATNPELMSELTWNLTRAACSHSRGIQHAERHVCECLGMSFEDHCIGDEY